ncbi:MAG: hypothetical protein IPJ62_09365 [Betaproteobacteria bacterium]|nr:hypothetical protein [Betaproteobacteria bacterium]
MRERLPRSSPACVPLTRAFCRPVPPFGGARRAWSSSGWRRAARCECQRSPFTGDHAGILLYATLHARGFATRNPTERGPITAWHSSTAASAMRCSALPPGNKPLPAEIRACNGYLAADLARVPEGGAVLALGRIAHEAALRALGERPSARAFAHGARHAVAGGDVRCYHCSRYNHHPSPDAGDVFAPWWRRSPTTCVAGALPMDRRDPPSAAPALRRSTAGAGWSPRCRIVRASTGCATRQASRCTSARRAI